MQLAGISLARLLSMYQNLLCTAYQSHLYQHRGTFWLLLAYQVLRFADRVRELEKKRKEAGLLFQFLNSF
jgi:hypothetical protein